MYHTRIHIKVRLSENWADWFDGLQLQHCAENETILCGNLPDMAAVYGVISRLGGLVIPVISIHCVELPVNNPVAIPAASEM